MSLRNWKDNDRNFWVKQLGGLYRFYTFTFLAIRIREDHQVYYRCQIWAISRFLAQIIRLMSIYQSTTPDDHLSAPRRYSPGQVFTFYKNQRVYFLGGQITLLVVIIQWLITSDYGCVLQRHLLILFNNLNFPLNL